ncbi:MAG: 6-pyruvoyl-tetrahydropterin synthase-related protein, partial [Desulfatiglandales bacterium]
SICGLLLYAYAYRLWQSDVRFLPFSQIILCISGITLVFQKEIFKRYQNGIGFITGFFLLYNVTLNIGNAKEWIFYSYSGLETKPRYTDFAQISGRIKGDLNSPRVIYEHNILNELCGTVRIFELLPFFSGRSTLEGVYMQTSPVSPYIFYLQSLLTKTPSTPFPEFTYGRFDVTLAYPRLNLLNVDTVIAVSDELKLRLQYSGLYRLLDRIGNYEVFEVDKSQRSYVYVPRYMPVVMEDKEWKYAFHDWFRLGNLEVPLVICKGNCKEFDNFPRAIDIRNLPTIVNNSKEPEKSYIASRNRIFIKGAEIGKPLIIKVSYHKNWKVKGADRIYMVSPGFMLIIPKNHDLELYYGKGMDFYIGLAFSVSGIILLFILKLNDSNAISSSITGHIISISFCFTLLILGLSFPKKAPEIAIRDVIKSVDDKQYKKALQTIENFVHLRYNIVLPQLFYYKGVCLENLGETKLAVKAYEEIANRFPDTDMAGYSLLKMAEIFRRDGKLPQAQELYRRCFETYQLGPCYDGFVELKRN